MNKEHPHQPQPFTLEAVTRHAIDTTLREGRHIPTLIVAGNQAAVLIQIGDVAATHEGRLTQMFTLGFSLAQHKAIGQTTAGLFCDRRLDEPRGERDAPGTTAVARPQAPRGLDRFRLRSRRARSQGHSYRDAPRRHPNAHRTETS